MSFRQKRNSRFNFRQIVQMVTGWNFTDFKNGLAQDTEISEIPACHHLPIPLTASVLDISMNIIL